MSNQVIKTGAIYTPNVGPHTGVAQAYIPGTPLTLGVNGKGYPFVPTMVDANGITKGLIGVGDEGADNDANFPGENADGIGDGVNPIAYDADAAYASDVKTGYFAFDSQFSG